MLFSTGLRPPDRIRWLLWDVDFDAVDLARDADGVIPRVLERGRLEDVRWLLDHYGEDRVHAFFRDVGHPEISPRTFSFWRAYFRAQDEPWPNSYASRKSSSAPWID
jgi:hypothetical protein